MRKEIVLGCAAMLLLSLFICWRHFASQPPTVSRELPASVAAPANLSDSTLESVKVSTNLPSEPPKGSHVGAEFLAGMMEMNTATDPYQRNEIEERLKAMLNATNAAVLVQSLPQEFLETTLGLLGQEMWAGVDRPAAVRWLAGRETNSTFQIDTILRNWVVEDNNGMHAYLDSLSSGEWKNKVLASLGKNALFNRDEEEAFFLAAALPSGSPQTHLVSSAILKWAQRDPNEALKQVEQLPDAALQEKVIPQIAYGYAMTHPDLAADWISKSLSPGDDLNKALGGIVEIWANNQDPRAAAKWVEGLPESSTQKFLLSKLVATWDRSDRPSLESWMANLSDNSFRANVSNELASLHSGVNQQLR